MSFHKRDMLRWGVQVGIPNRLLQVAAFTLSFVSRESGWVQCVRVCVKGNGSSFEANMQSLLTSLIMKRFGFVPGMPKPKTDLDWARIFNKHKIEVPSVKKLSLTLSSKGPGQTGARYDSYR
jgi:hypothetical protein